MFAWVKGARRGFRRRMGDGDAVLGVQRVGSPVVSDQPKSVSSRATSGVIATNAA